MRLPWPFNRTQRAAAAPADSTDSLEIRPSGPQAWRDLPALQRSVGGPPLIAPTPPFRAELAGATPAPIALAPLGHGRGLDAPVGIVRNVATAVPVSPAKGAPTLRRRHQTAVEAPAVESPTAPSEVALTAPSLPTVQAEQVETSAAVATRTRQRASLVSAQGQPSLPPLPVGRVGASQKAPAVQRAPVSASTPTATPTLTDTKGAVATVPGSAPQGVGAERLTLGQSRRLGLGAPIEPTFARSSHPLATAESAKVTSAEPAAPHRDVPIPALRDFARQTTAPKPIADEPAVPTAAPPDPAPSRAAGRVQHAPDESTPIVAPIRQRRLPSTAVAAGAASAPLVGARPMRAAVQRAPLATPAAPGSTSVASSEQSSARAGTEPVRIHRGAEANEMAGALDARAFTHGGEIYLPDRHGPIGGEQAQSLLAHEMTHVVQQRRMGSSLPDESTAHGQRLEAEAVAAETHDMPLAVPANASPARTSSPAVPQSVPAAPAAFSIEAPIRESGTQRASANDAKFTDPDDAFRDKLRSNEDELFATFERRLRHQLLHERERGGTLIDAL